MAARLRSFWVLVVAVLLFGTVAGSFAETVKSMPQPTAYVNDYAGVLNDATKSDLDALLKQLDTQAKAQVFVAVIKKIDDDSTPAEFANQLYAKWKPGPKADSRGAVLLISVEDHKYQFEPTAYVNDYAGVLNDATKSDLDALLKQLDTQAKAQVFVAVIKKIDDDSTPAEFANQLYAKWKPGPKADSRGAVLLISVEDHKYQFEIGYGLEGILPDGKTGDIGREMVPDLKSGNYDGAVRTAVNDLTTVIAQDANVTLDVPQQAHTYHREAVQQRSHGNGVIGLLVFLFILFLLIRGGGGRGGPGGFLTGMLLGGLMGGNRGGGGGFGDGGGFGGGGGGGGGEGGSSGGGGAGGSW